MKSDLFAYLFSPVFFNHLSRGELLIFIEPYLAYFPVSFLSISSLTFRHFFNNTSLVFTYADVI